MLRCIKGGIKMYSINNEIDIISIPFLFVNTFLISYKDSYMLVDTGYPKNAKKLYSKISLITLDPELHKLKAIIVTHHHSDHTGAVSYFKNINPEIKIIAHKNCFKYMEKGDNDFSSDFYTNSIILQLLTKLSHKISKKSVKFTPYIKKENDIEIENIPIYINIPDGNIVEEGKINEKNKEHLIKIFPTLGHTDDSISIKIGKYLICGDLAASSFNIFGTKYLPIIFNNLETIYNSWKQILNEKIELILPSHGEEINKNELDKNLFSVKRVYKI